MIVLFVLLGLLVGGLINQLGSDLPARRKPTRPHCPYCGQNRRWWQWLALPAYLAGRHKCRSCGAPVRLRHPLVEIGLAVAYGYLWIALGPSVKLVVYLVYAAIFALILITDVERRLILNVVTFPAMLLAIVASFFVPQMTWWSALLGGAIAFALFLVVALVGNVLFGGGALGGGDVTLATFIGLATGFPLVIESLTLAILIGAVVSLLLLVARVRRLRDYVPYGPFLVAGAAITLLWGYSIAEWFLQR
jgi:prepilin signal peptidase PulO-like enzyme (type II secretory pathway)